MAAAYRPFSITWILLAVVGGMLLAPLQASAAHGAADQAVASAMSEHGHIHAEQQVDAHDAVDHAHDMPCFSVGQTTAAASESPVWNMVQRATWLLQPGKDMERPPKPAI